MNNLTNRQLNVIEWNKAYYAKQAEKENHGKRWINNRVEKVVEHMNNIANANEITEVRISVEWKKSRTWGNCPTATVEVFSKDSEGYSNRDEYITKASGCGYDKESSVVGQAFNQSEILLKIAYDAIEKDIDSKPYGLNEYESGVSFGQGVGMSCYRNMAKYFGLEWDEQHGNTWDFYKLTKSSK
jgi:hypothetical protein